MSRVLATFALAAILCAPAMASSEDLAAAEQQIRAAFDKVDTFSATAALEANVAIMEGMPPVALVGGGDVAFKKTGAGPAFCYNLSVGPPNAQMPLAKALVVSDGKDMGITATLMVQEFAMKKPATPEEGALPPGGGPLLDALHKYCNVALTGTEKVDDVDVYVLDVAPTTPQPEIPIAKGIVYIDKNLGVLRKVALFKTASELTGTVTLRDVKLNPVLSDSLFVVVTPPPKEPEAPKPEATPAAATTTSAADTAKTSAK